MISFKFSDSKTSVEISTDTIEEFDHVFAVTDVLTTTASEIPQAEENDPVKVFGGAEDSNYIIEPPEANGGFKNVGTETFEVNNATFPPSDVDVDCNGIPWDHRIHSRTRSKNVDGSWRVKRGIEPTIVKQVAQELRQVMDVPPPPPIPVAAAVTPTPVVPAPPTSTTPADFTVLMRKITAAISAGELSREHVLKIANDNGLPSIVLAANRPDLIPALMAAVEAEIANA